MFIYVEYLYVYSMYSTGTFLAKVLEKKDNLYGGLLYGQNYGNLKNIQMYVPVFNAAKL